MLGPDDDTPTTPGARRSSAREFYGCLAFIAVTLAAMAALSLCHGCLL